MRTTLVLTACIVCPASVMADKPVAPEVAIKIMETFEGRIASAQWEGLSDSGPASDPLRPDSIASTRPPGTYDKRRIWYEPLTGRYRIEWDSVVGMGTKREPFFAQASKHTFDGLTHRYFDQIHPGQNLPVANEGVRDANIRPGDTDRVKTDWGGWISYFPPNYFGVRFSDFLRERLRKKLHLQITEEQGGPWRIDTLEDNHELTCEQARITFDPVRGIVLEVERIGKPDAKIAKWRGKVARKQTMTWVKAQGGIWVPRTWFDYNFIDGIGHRLDFVNVRINEGIDPSLFRIDFPVGTRVRDYVEKMDYTVTGGHIDEKQAIQDFIRTEELGRNRYGKPWHQSLTFKIMLMTILTLGIFFVTRSVWRHRRAAAGVAVILACVGSIPAATPDDAGNWIVSHAPGERIKITQCGLNVAMFVLEYHGVSFDGKILAAGLPPSQQGIRFSDIKTMLEAHGLQISARAGVRLSDIKRVVRGGSLAIFPVKVSDSQNHYLVAINDERRGIVVVDPPNKIHKLEVVTEDSLASLGGVVLFADRPSTGLPSQSSRITITPERSDFGTFRGDDPATYKAFEIRVAIENVSDAPVIIKWIRPSCGCMSVVEGDCGLLAAGERRDVTLSVSPSVWGSAGRVERTLAFSFQDGSTSVCRFAANVVPVRLPQYFKVAPGMVRIEQAGPARIGEGESRIYLNEAQPDQIKVRCTEPWLKAELHSETPSRLLVRLRADLGAAGSLPAECDLVVTGAEGMPPVSVRVQVARGGSFRVEPAIVNRRANATEVSIVRVVPVKSGTVPAVGFRVVSAPPEMKIERRDGRDGQVTLAISAANLPTGAHLVECVLGSETSADAVVRLVVCIADGP